MKKSMKLLPFILALLVCACGFFAACGGGDDKGKLASTDSSKVLVAYFSATGNTEKAAGYIAGATGGTLYEIVPEVPYTQEDLNYNDSTTRATTEQHDPNARPAIQGSVENMAEYDVIYLGYPIWWGEAPKIIYTFLESYDFSGKTIVPFCTSGSSGIGSSATNLHSLAGGATWLSGKRFSSSPSKSEVEEWVNGLNDDEAEYNQEEQFVDTIYLTIGTHKITVKLEENIATKAFVELLKEGDLSYTAHDYGGFEKVGSLGHALPHEDRQMTTEAGDVILYSGDQIVLFYGSNSWSYTKIGKIQGSASEIKEILTESNPIIVTMSLR